VYLSSEYDNYVALNKKILVFFRYKDLLCQVYPLGAGFVEGVTSQFENLRGTSKVNLDKPLSLNPFALHEPLKESLKLLGRIFSSEFVRLSLLLCNKKQ
jgi:hypothetical protein